MLNSTEGTELRKWEGITYNDTNQEKRKVDDVRKRKSIEKYQPEKNTRALRHAGMAKTSRKKKM